MNGFEARHLTQAAAHQLAAAEALARAIGALTQGDTTAALQACREAFGGINSCATSAFVATDLADFDTVSTLYYRHGVDR